MSVGREDSPSKPDELQIGSSWVPVTPAKPGSTNRQPICTNWGEHQRVEVNLVETEKLSSTIQVSQTTQCQRQSACYASMSLNAASNSHVYKENMVKFDSWLARGEGVIGKDSSTYENFSMHDSDQWSNISFGNLMLAMGKNTAMEDALTHDNSCFQPQCEGNFEDPLARADFADPNIPTQVEGSQLGANFDAQVRMTTNNVTDRSSIPATHLLDLNSPPKTITDATLKTSGPWPFEPITPEKTNRGEYQQGPATKHSSVDEAPTGEKKDISSDGVMQLHEKKEKSHLVNDELSEVASTQLQENHKPDKGDIEEADLVKTPQQKTRRKKHRPKVIIEGQLKNTPKSSAQKTSVPKETTRVKRKYVRKNGVNNCTGGGTNGTDSDNKTLSSTETPVVKRKYRRRNETNKSEDTDKETTETTEIQPPRHTRRSCRRSLNFNSDDPGRDGISSDLPSSNLERELQAENLDSRDQPETAHCTQEMEVIMKNKDMVTSRVCTRSMNRLREDFLSVAKQHPQSSRRSLNFNSDDPGRDGISSDLPSSNLERELQAENLDSRNQPETAHCTQEMEIIMKNKDMVTSRVCSRSMNQFREDFQSVAKQHPQSSLPHINKDTLKENHVLTDTREKCDIVFSAVTQNKEANTVQVSKTPDGQMTQNNPIDSISSGTCLNPEKQIKGLERQCTDKPVEASLCNRNERGIMYNSLEAYLSVFTQNADNTTPGLHFPEIYKKRRTEKVYSTVTSSMQITTYSDNGVKLDRHTLRDSCKNLFASTNQGSYGVQSQVTKLLTTKHATDGTLNGRQVFEDLLALGPTQRVKRRRSKAPTRQRKLASLLENGKQRPNSPGRTDTISRTEQNIEILNEPPTCTEALVADACSTMATKKRSKRRMLINSTVQNMYNHQNIAGTSMGPPLALTWKTMSPVESITDITDKFNQLDLNAESRSSEEKYTAFMSYHNYYKESNALVQFQSSRAVVPFDSSFDQVMRKKPRPKVDLDDETTRVWKLLLENINSEGIDGTNEDNTKWWEEERRVFIGRADSFIARMHLVQGDRRFSPWKGSVVDSVVGVFLTQNVSDHLSSSAFMSLAARFPVNPMIHSAELHDKRSGGEINEPEVCVLDSDGTFVLTKEILTGRVCGEDPKTLQEFEDDSIREVNSMKPSRNASGNDSIQEGDLRGQLTDTSLGSVISCEIIANRSVCLNEDAKDTEDTLSSQTPEISSQNSAYSPIARTTRKNDTSLLSTSEEAPTAGVNPNWLTSSTSFVKLLQKTESVLHGTYGEGSDERKSDEREYVPSERLACSLRNEDHLENPTVPANTIASCCQSSLCGVPNSGAQSTEFNLYQKNSKLWGSSSEKELCTAEISELSSESASGTTFQKSTAVSFGIQKLPGSIACSSNNKQIEMNQKKVDNQRGQDKMQGVLEKPTYQQNLMDAAGSSSNIDNLKNSEHKEVNSKKNGLDNHPEKMMNGPKSKISKQKENQVDWDQLRKQTPLGGRKRERTSNTLDSVDWDAIRCADVHEIAQTIKERGMNNVLAERIKDFLDRIVRDHGSIDLEWLRDVPPDKAKEYLLSIRGLGLKSVECVRLLTLHHLAFPVDTNVGRIAVRLGWVPLQPLPESLQLHLLELYPILESIQKYLWPRLCKLDQKTLYELHYQMITFGKVFCTKSKPNCNACPMRAECRHFASAYASARLSLPAPPGKSIVSATESRKADQNPIKRMATLQLPSPQTDEMDPESRVSNSLPIIEEPQTPEPIIEVPATPERDCSQATECDIESTFSDDPDEIPTIQLNMEQFSHNLQTIMQQNTELEEGEMSKALVALTSEAASIPVPKLKNMSRLRTEHHVYELPDSHPLLEGMDKREPDDPSPYLLAIWTPGETMDSVEPPEKRCSAQELEKLCTDETCSACNSIREAKSQTVRGTLLIPCRTAMRGSFPLNGTYFQVNEVFSDHESSLSPMDIPRKWLWNLPRRTVYFGTSIPTIFKGLSTEGIQYCFWRGFVCVRGFDRKTRAPRPLIARLHFPASKLAKGKEKIDES